MITLSQDSSFNIPEKFRNLDIPKEQSFIFILYFYIYIQQFHYTNIVNKS
jgi:hypothetical protein